MIVIEVWQHAHGVQVSIGDENGGYRLLGPKFDGTSRLVAKRVLKDRDAKELAFYADRISAAVSP